MSKKITITPEDFIFSVSSTKDNWILHVDVKNHSKFRFDFPLTERNAQQLKNTLDMMLFPEEDLDHEDLDHEA